MNLKELKYKANYYILLLLVFVIPLDRRLGALLVGLFVLSSFINYKPKEKRNPKILLFALPFMVYFISLSYASDFSDGIEELIKKLSLLVFPIAVYFSNINYREKMDSILTTFIEGCLTSGLISLISSAIHYYFTLDSTSFFYGNSSVFLHVSYFDMYANFAILILYHFIFNQKKEKNFTILRVGIILFLSVMVVTSASKTGLISMLIVHSGAIIYWIRKEKSWTKGVVVIFVFITVLSIVFLSSSTLRNRFNELIKVTTTNNLSSHSSTAARVEIWKIANDLIQEKPWIGYGVGAVHQHLMKEYKSRGFNDLYQKKLNAHNQIYQTTLTVGLIGGIIMLFSLILPMVMAIKQREFLYLFFLLLLVFNLMTEAMFERQAGVVFYALFNAVFFVVLLEKKNNKILSVKS